MAGMQDKIEQRRRMLEKLAGMVPGYTQYQQQEKRRDADHANRQFFYEHLRKGIDSLKDVALKLTNEGKLDRLADIDREERKLRTVADRIRLADYGYAGFFDAYKVQEEELDRLYAFDEGLAEQIQTVVNKAAAVSAAEDIGAGLDDLDAAIEALDEQFDGREKHIMGVM